MNIIITPYPDSLKKIGPPIPNFIGETRHSKDSRQTGRQKRNGGQEGGRREISPGKTMIYFTPSPNPSPVSTL